MFLERQTYAWPEVSKKEKLKIGSFLFRNFCAICSNIEFDRKISSWPHFLFRHHHGIPCFVRSIYFLEFIKAASDLRKLLTGSNVATCQKLAMLHDGILQPRCAYQNIFQCKLWAVTKKFV